MTKILAHWWNQHHGGIVRKDVWVELLDTGRYQVRWRGGDWRDRDGTWRTHDKHAAWNTVKLLTGDGGSWKRLD